jgi:site-specific DNA-methyltransferase (adenine-specific)
MSDFYGSIYNPDVLTCLANLSSDEVFTPPEVANQMLDLLPPEIWQDKTATFLDPACKSGVFLREIAKRLIEGLAEEIPDLQQRIDHIFQKQLYGIAITEITSLLSRRSLYCSKFPNSKYSISQFENASGNILYRRVPHTWQNGKCVFCGASQSEYDRGDDLETHAYEWIHTVRPEEIFGMKFDVIIGNPPYQLSDGGAQASSIPIYQKFVEQAQKLRPRFLIMIIPARWYSGGRGLNDFRSVMLTENKIRVLHDFSDSSICFPGVEIKGGVCYFLWERDTSGLCEVVNYISDNVPSSTLRRYLLEKGSDIFIRQNKAISIFQKVRQTLTRPFSSIVSTQRPFGLRTFEKGRKNIFPDAIKMYENGGIGYIPRSKVTINYSLIDTYKVFVSRAYGASENFPHQIIGKPILGIPGTCCSETYIMIGPFKNQEETKNVISYMQTKFFRFLVSLKKISQMASASVYEFVPMQDFSKSWIDEELYAKYNLIEEEIDFIDSMIKPMELGGVENEF